MKNPIHLLLAGTLIASGCSTTKKVRVLPEPIPPAISIEPSPGYYTRPPVTRIDAPPVPIYKNPIFTKVYVAAYINEKGEAFPASFKYVMAKPGSYNLEALENPERAYIPSENAQAASHAPGYATGAVVPGDAPSNQSDGILPTRAIFDMSKVRITGYFAPDDELKVRTEAERIKPEFGDYAVAFDANLGWLIIPQTALRPAKGGQPASKAILKDSSQNGTGKADSGELQ
jgi:hypothetical protein